MKRRIFGELDGAPVEAVTLESPEAAVTILSFGCVLQDWRIGGLPVVLGFADLPSYLTASRSHGAIVGRVANRTAGASFEMDGRTYALTANHGPEKQHHIHGGATGLGVAVVAVFLVYGVVWTMARGAPLLVSNFFA